MRSATRWAKLKSRQRAVEKLFRCYRFDVSRLLDCCRQSLYFEDVRGIHECMRIIESDPSVELMRLCNKLQPSYNAKISAGYRDVLINLRLKTEETRRLCIDLHVCEVQLVLIDFAKTKVSQRSPQLFRPKRSGVPG